MPETEPGPGSAPSPHLYGRRSPTPWIVAALVAAVAALIVFLVVGGNDGPIEDPSDDLAYGAGASGDAPEPIAATAADVIEASVDARDGLLSFAVEMQAPIPDRYESAVLEITWRISSSEGSWVVAGTIADSVVGSITAEDGGYGASTVDDTFPGTLDISGSTATVRFDPSEIAGFPDSFEWFVSTRLAADRTVPDSESVRDRAPDDAVVSFPG